jgi:hypothetical protein
MYQRDKPIIKHFKNQDERDLHVAVMSKTFGEHKAYRLIVEENWIKSLERQTPQGCNIESNWLTIVIPHEVRSLCGYNIYICN